MNLLSWSSSHEKFPYVRIPSKAFSLSVIHPPNNRSLLGCWIDFLVLNHSLAHLVVFVLLEPSGRPKYVAGNSSIYQPKFLANSETVSLHCAENMLLLAKFMWCPQTASNVYKLLLDVVVVPSQHHMLLMYHLHMICVKPLTGPCHFLHFWSFLPAKFWSCFKNKAVSPHSNGDRRGGIYPVIASFGDNVAVSCMITFS